MTVAPAAMTGRASTNTNARVPNVLTMVFTFFSPTPIGAYRRRINLQRVSVSRMKILWSIRR